MTRTTEIETGGTASGTGRLFRPRLLVPSAAAAAAEGGPPPRVTPEDTVTTTDTRNRTPTTTIRRVRPRMVVAAAGATTRPGTAGLAPAGEEEATGPSPARLAVDPARGRGRRRRRRTRTRTRVRVPFRHSARRRAVRASTRRHCPHRPQSRSTPRPRRALLRAVAGPRMPVRPCRIAAAEPLRRLRTTIRLGRGGRGGGVEGGETTSARRRLR